jgi:dTMP kinase
VRKQLLPALAQNEVVLSDRYADATVAYQGAGRGFDPALIQEIVELATGGLKPDLTLLFDLSVAESAVRTRKRVKAKRTDRLDIEDAEFHTRVRDAYVEIAKAAPERFRIIDARGSVEETHKRVMEIVFPFLEERGLMGRKEQSAKGQD